MQVVLVYKKCLMREHKAVFVMNEVVGAEGFEPPASCAERKRSTRLSYAPTARNEHDFGEDSGVRTHDLAGFYTFALCQLSYVLVNHTRMKQIRFAGARGIEPPTVGFGIRCSTNCATRLQRTLFKKEQLSCLLIFADVHNVQSSKINKKLEKFLLFR